MTNDHTRVRGCELLGELEAGDHLNGGDARPIAWWNCTRKLRNAAAAKGANVLLITGSHTNISTHMTGRAYRCPEPPAAPR